MGHSLISPYVYQIFSHYYISFSYGATIIRQENVN